MCIQSEYFQHRIYFLQKGISQTETHLFALIVVSVFHRKGSSPLWYHFEHTSTVQ